jgi:hypothetical protein
VAPREAGAAGGPVALVRGRIGDIVDEWLVGEMGEEDAALARTAARMYADFLTRHIDLGSVSAWLGGRVDAAFQQWRAQAERGHA